MKKILIVTAVPETVSAFLTGYIKALASIYDVHIACSLDGKQVINGVEDSVTLHDITIARQPSILADLKSLWQLRHFFKQHKFDLIHSVTPKAGLLTQLAAWLTGCPHRLHTFTGQVWATKQGVARFALKSLDKLTARLTTTCLADSQSQRAFIEQEGIIGKGKCQVLANGSISGVNTEKFQYSSQARADLRTEFNLSDDTFVFLFVGRLKYDKGIPELMAAFEQLTPSRPTKLVIIGKDEDNLLPLVSSKKNVIFAGFKTNVSDFYSFADTLVLPSHREGFGNVVIEAAACGLPTIASNIYGLSDAVEHQYSGLLHPVQNAAALKQCMQTMLDDPALLSTYKKQAKQRVDDKFDEQLLISAFLALYADLLAEESAK